MKQLIIFLVCGFPLLLSAQQDFVGSLMLPAHPRLLLMAGEEKKILKSISTDANWNMLNTRILDECDRMLTLETLKRELIGKRLLDKSREALRRIFFLSYAWRISGKEEYARRAERELLSVASFSDWHPNHFLDVGEMTLAVAIGYDWLYSCLSSTSRAIIKEAIIEKGIRPSMDPNYNRFLGQNSNWNQVCNTGIALGAMAVAEDEPKLAKDIVNRSIGSIRLPMNAYMPDGAYAEGYNYWDYGTTFNTMFITALQKAYGSDFGLGDEPGFLKTGAYMLHMTAPSGNCFNYSDTGMGNALHTAMFWFAGKLKDPSLLWFERNHFQKKDPKAKEGNRLLPTAMIWGAGLELDHAVLPAVNSWVGDGLNPVALMRSDWTSGGIFLGFKGGSPSVSHGHMDVGSFVLEADGIRWASDLGMQKYETLEAKGIDLWNMSQNAQRWTIFRLGNLAHNTLIANDELQNVDGNAKIISRSANPAMLNAVVDMRTIYKELPVAKRGVAIIDKRYVQITDEIASGDRSVMLRWNLLTNAKVRIISNKKIELTKNGKSMLLEAEFSGEIRTELQPADPIQLYDDPNPGYSRVSFVVSLPANSRKTLHCFFLPNGLFRGSVPPLPLGSWPNDQNNPY